MAKIGFFSLPWQGHLNPMASLARELESRGHQAIFFHLPEFASAIEGRGCRFVSYAPDRFPPGEFALRNAELSSLSGDQAFSAALAISQSLCAALLEEAEVVVGAAELDLWVIDQLDYGAATLAAKLGQPFVTAAVVLLKHDEVGVPGYNGEAYGQDPQSLEREARLAAHMASLIRPFLKALNGYRRAAGMEDFSYQTIWSSLAQVSQQPPEFEFPRKQLPDCFHFTGPFARPEDRSPLPFPWERLSGQPLVYASLGTAQRHQSRLYQAILDSVRGMDVQLVLSLAGATDLDLRPAPPNALVLPLVPQLEVLQRASAMITHAGMNSTLECLAAGVPMVAVPISHDQPGVAARIEWTGTGLKVPAARCDASTLSQALTRVLADSSFRERAERFRHAIAARDGRRMAGDIIEQVLGPAAN
jgi:MGT family glycosyltransferase